jgi:hypothetical protein
MTTGIDLDQRDAKYGKRSSAINLALQLSPEQLQNPYRKRLGVDFISLTYE